MTSLVHLLVPGLLGPLPTAAREWEALRRPCEGLELLFGRGSRRSLPRRGFYDRVRAHFELEPANPDLPAGALGLLGEGGAPEAAFWLRADPVHLRPDRDRLMLFADPSLQPTAAEAAILAADCNSLLVQDDLELRIGPLGGWYLRSERPIALETIPTGEVAGRYLDAYLPRGADARRWLRLQTELQMVLHGSAANIQREERAQAAVNGLWIWGAGVLPARVQASWTSVLSDEATLRGAAVGAGVEWIAGADPARLRPDGRQLVSVDVLGQALATGDLESWLAALARFEQEWLAPLLESLRAGRLDELVVETGGRSWTLTAARLRGFWRRPRRLLRELEFEDADAD